MSTKKFKLNRKYRSKVNNIAVGCVYEIIKKEEKTCWVKLWEEGKPTDMIYKNVSYSILAS